MSVLDETSFTCGAHMLIHLPQAEETSAATRKLIPRKPPCDLWYHPKLSKLSPRWLYGGLRRIEYMLQDDNPGALSGKLARTYIKDRRA